MGIRGRACRYQHMNRVLAVYKVHIMHSRRYGILVPWYESELKGNPLLIAEDVPAVVSVVERCMAPLRNTICQKGCLLFLDFFANVFDILFSITFPGTRRGASSFGPFRECLRHVIRHNIPRVLF